MLLDLHQIELGSRIREELGNDFADLKASIQKVGQLQPILVEPIHLGAAQVNTKLYRVVAGGRRFIAITQLNAEGKEINNLPVGKIRAEIYGQMTPHYKLILEHEENIRRRDLSYIEKAKFIRHFHEMMTTQNEGNWTAELTAAMLRLSTASISHYLRVEDAARNNPEVAKAQTLDAAVKRMKTIEKLSRRWADVQATDPSVVVRAEKVLKLGDARSYIGEVASESIDLINFDPPWGEEASHKVQENWEEFDDSTSYSDELASVLLPELYRILKADRFLVFWFRTWALNSVVELCERSGFSVRFGKTPCIWYKPDKVSDQMRFPEKQLIDSYETFLLVRKGDPVFHEKEVQNVFSEPRVPKTSKVHPTEKPLSLMNRLVRLLSLPGEMVFDPTAGSSSFLESAVALKRKALGVELSQKYYERGITRLTEALRKFRES